jgi:organic radical activating enzyme
VTPDATLREGATLVVSEVFGPTHQGEGPHSGKLCAFVRLMGCNLSCSWCDTPYTWDGTRFDLHAEGTRMHVDQVWQQVAAMHVPIVVLSGGEPLLHQRQEGWVSLLALLSARHQLHVETNGTILPDVTTRAAVQHFTVSPKLPNANMPRERRIIPEVIEAWGALAHSRRACFKMVCATARDVQLVDTWVGTFDLPRSEVWVMPEGATRDELLAHTPEVTAAAADYGLNISSRLHVLAHDTKRGV